jgi:hypothetical protein
MSEEPKTVTGWVAGIAAGIAMMAVSAPVALVAGVVNVVKGEKFSEPFDEIVELADEALEAAGKWGDRHNETVKRIAISSAISTVTGDVMHHHHLLPDTTGVPQPDASQNGDVAAQAITAGDVHFGSSDYHDPYGGPLPPPNVNGNTQGPDGTIYHVPPGSGEGQPV